MQKQSLFAYVCSSVALFSEFFLFILITSNASVLFLMQGTYLTIIGPIAAGSITFAGIVFSFYLKEESILLIRMKTYLRNCISHLADWRSKAIRESEAWQRIYDNTEKEWSKRMQKLRVVGYPDLLLAFLPVAFFIFSIVALLIHYGFDGSLWLSTSLVLFSSGAVFLFLDIAFLIRRLVIIESMKTFFGEGKLLVNKINDEKIESSANVIKYQPSPNAETIDVELCFEGIIRNGFFHAVVESERLRKAVPDVYTYFQDVRYTSNLMVLVDPEYDTGVLQGNYLLAQARTRMKIDLWLEGFTRELNPRKVRERVGLITLGVYEDPVDLPSADPKRAKFSPTDLPRERHCIGKVVVSLSHSEQANAEY